MSGARLGSRSPRQVKGTSATATLFGFVESQTFGARCLVHDPKVRSCWRWTALRRPRATDESIPYAASGRCRTNL
jgi:hypothetical protein